MQTRWQAPKNLRLWMLAWLLAATCAAVASPFLKHRPVQLACSGSGHAVLLVHTAEGLLAADTPGMDCPLCLPADMPPPCGAPGAAAPPTAPPALVSGPAQCALSCMRHRPPARAPPPVFFTEPT